MDIKKLYQQYSLNTYARVGPVFVRGRGSWVWDDTGSRYLDLFPGWGVSILGHSHPRVAEVIGRQAKRLIHLPNNLFFKEQILLAKEIISLSFSSKVFFANSGAEAVEGAIKFSRLFGGSKKYEIITMDNSFHGRTFGALSATGQKKYKDVFKPLLPGFKEAKFNDYTSFRSKVTSKTTAVILELIQGEGGVRAADKEYVKKVERYCRRNNVLFIVDEVQTGMGRTGKLFCYQNYSVVPDIMLLSKGLGAGVPISAMVVKKEIADIMKPGMHASTFGGSPFISRVSQEVFKIIKEEKLLRNVGAMGSYLHRRLREFKNKFSFVKESRGMGLMAGLDLQIDSYPVFLECLKRKLIVNSTHKTVLRVMPALNITKQELDKGLGVLEEVLSKIRIRK